MADRRMFAKSIIDSDAFLEMPLSAQALYFHLAMRADDDGFVGNPNTIRSYIGAKVSDKNLLIQKRFLLVFESGVIAIKHWRIHNTIRTDRYKPTTYFEEKSTLILDDKKAYVEQAATKWQPNDNQVATQDSIGKDSIGKDSITPSISPSSVDDRFDTFWQAYPKKVGKAYAKKCFDKLKPSAELTERMIKAIEEQKRSLEWKRDNGQYIPNPSTWLNQGRWDDELSGELTDQTNTKGKNNNENIGDNFNKYGIPGGTWI